MLRPLLAAVLFLIAAPALAADPAGRWELRASDTILMVFEVKRTPAGWTATWQRPAHFSSDGDTFSRVTGPVITRIARSAREVANGIELSFDDPAPGATPDIFVIRADKAAVAQLSYIGFGPEPATLIRVTDAGKIGSWDPAQTYIRAVARSTSIKMTAIFDADQAARAQPMTMDWKVVSAADEARRVRTQALLDAGKLESGDDFYHAAFVFQHGGEPSDYLKAHALAVIATARGKPAATWIAAATLDRYLQSIGQSQVYGTQFSNKDGKWTQEAYRRNILSDALRVASRVPPMSEQEAQRLRYEKQAD